MYRDLYFPPISGGNDSKTKYLKIEFLVFFLNSDVRSKAFQAVDQFLLLLKQYYEKVSLFRYFLQPLLKNVS